MTHSSATPATRLRAITLVALWLALAGCPEPEAPTPPVEPPAEQELSTVVVHFTMDEQPVPLERQVARADAGLRTALELQLQGPTEQERARGYFSWFSGETAGMLNRVAVDDEGHAVVDFEDFSGIIPNASASAGSRILMGELNATVFQFPNVRSVEYRFEGSCEAFFEWLQGECRPILREGTEG